MATLSDATVLIVGAGPTGLVLAVELARRGISFRLVDRSAEVFGGSRADAITPRTLEVFDDLGLVDTVLAEGNTGIKVRGYQGEKVIWEGETTEPMPACPDVPYPNIWFLPQLRTEELLRQRLAGLGRRVERPTELVALVHDESGVTATLTTNGETEQVRAQYLVGADGGASTVRKLLGIRFEGDTDESLHILFADVALEGLDRDHGRVWMSGGSGVALMPLSGTDLFTFTGPPPAQGEPTLAYVQSLVTEATGRPEIRLHKLTWSTVWRPNARKAERFREGRVFLAGDAAHVFPPTGGQGMNTGIQDAYNLGWKLAAVVGGGPASLLDSYQIERGVAANAALALSTGLLEKHKRGDEDAGRRGAEVHQLGLHYRDSPLTRELRAVAGEVAAGDRAPDAPGLATAAGKSRLFDLLRGTHFTVLAFGAGWQGLINELRGRFGSVLRSHTIVAAQGDADHIVDTEGHAMRAYDIHDRALLLIRPDGYIGFATQDGAVEPVMAYLSGLSA